MRGGYTPIVLLSVMLVVPYAAGTPAGIDKGSGEPAPASGPQDPALDQAALPGPAAVEAAEVLPWQDPDPRLDRLATDLEMARQVLEPSRNGEPDSLADAVAAAKAASRWQATALGMAAGKAELPDHDAPSEAVRALLEQRGVQLSPGERADVAALDALEPDAAAALTDLVDAFLALDRAAEAAFPAAGPGHPGVPAGTPAPGAIDPGQPLREAGADLAPVFAAREEVLDAASALARALERPADHQDGPNVNLPPALALDFSPSQGNHYTDDVALLVDAGGDDTYHNNAGGGCLVSATLVDLGRGADAYGDPQNPRDCGVNGGGALGGAGLLVDAGGPDTYAAGSTGTNGGGDFGVGMLVDAHGSDTYTAGSVGTNGGGGLGAGLLVDALGDDAYDAGSRATNGGGRGGAGALVDQLGDDAYTAASSGTNGGADFAGAGALVDGLGQDTYTAQGRDVNGGARTGTGFLLDSGGGQDRYRDALVDCTACIHVPKGAWGAQIDTSDGFRYPFDTAVDLTRTAVDTTVHALATSTELLVDDDPWIQPGDRASTPLGGCTLNFAFDGTGALAGNVYVGIADHCVDDGDRVATWMPEDGGGVEMVEFGTVVFDRVDEGSGPTDSPEHATAEDFALIRVDAGFEGQVRAEVKGWGAPTGVAGHYETEPLDPILHSGHGTPFSFAKSTREARFGVLTGDDARTWTSVSPAWFGDSGGPVLHEPSGKALGIVTQVGVILSPTSGVDTGPTVANMLDTFAEEGFPVELRTG